MYDVSTYLAPWIQHFLTVIRTVCNVSLHLRDFGDVLIG